MEGGVIFKVNTSTDNCVTNFQSITIPIFIMGFNNYNRNLFSLS